VSSAAPAPKNSASAEAREALDKLAANVGRVIRGKDQAIKLCITSLLARGHLLIEDIPGVGKTTLARSLAASVGGSFRRIQFTSDMLPSDIVGVSMFKAKSQEFEFREGPIFSNIVLADEINRTTPRTQSALLEAMSEGKVSVDDVTHDLPETFMVIATQNPAEHFGTYPLPESQMDRFLLRIRIGYPSPEQERAILRERGATDPVASLKAVIDHETLRALQDAVESVSISDSLLDYAMTFVEQTRQSPRLEVGVSTRGGIAWYRAAQARAMVDGRDFCVPDDFKELAVPALAHRVVLTSAHDSLAASREEAEAAISEIASRIPIPT
jgi:MoxR-like ATPase